MSLKEKLLSLNIVEDNEYLDKYVELIESNRNTKREKFKTQKHHIIPRYYYKLNNLNLDNSKENTVNLVYSDHILAHYYISLCSISIYKYKSYHSFLYLYKLIQYRDDIVEDKEKLIDGISKLKSFDDIYYEDKKLEALNSKGGKWVTNDKIQRYARKYEIEYYKSLGYHIGKLPPTEKQYESWKNMIQNNIGKKHSENWNRKISEANKGKKMSKETRENISKSLRGRTAWNAGLTKEDKRVAKNIKNGFEKTQFKKGSVPWNKNKKGCFSEETRRKMSESAKRRCRNEKK